MTERNPSSLPPAPIADFLALEWFVLQYCVALVRRQHRLMEEYGLSVTFLRDLEEKVAKQKDARSDWELEMTARAGDSTDTPF